MKLNDPIVTAFEFEGVEYPLDLSFNKVLDVFDCIRDDVLHDVEKAQVCVAILTGRKQVPFPLVVDLWLYLKTTFIDQQEEDEVKYDLQGNPMPVVKTEEERVRLIDFEKDAAYIYASFQQAYGISLLRSQDTLTWTEFRALLHALPDDTIMQRIIEIRAWEPQKGESREYQKKMRRLQEKYRLEEIGEEG